MPNATSKLATTRPDLVTFEQLSHEMQSRGYVATRIMPPINVDAQTGNFNIITLKSMLATAGASTRRTSRAAYNRGDYEFEPRKFETAEDGWEEPVDDREESIYPFLELERLAAGRAWEHVLNSLEHRVIAKAVDGTVAAGQTAAAAAVWSDFANSKPIDDIFAASNEVWQRTGRFPNLLTIGRQAFRNLRRSVQVLAEIASGGAGDSQIQARVTKQLLAEVLDVDEIVVADSIRNTANPAQKAVLATVFPADQALLSISNDSPDFRLPNLGRIFHFGGDGSEMGDDNRMIGVAETYREEQTRGDIVRVRHETAEVDIYSEAGQVITGLA